MKIYDFVLVYEHKVREIESLCLLKLELEKRGYSVLIKCYHDLEIVRTKNRICKPKYYAKVLGVFACYDTYTLRICVQNCIAFDKVIDMQWEQMVSRNQERENSYRNFREIGKEVVHISWGEANAERLIKTAHMDSRKVITCGNISLDLLKEQFRSYYMSRNEINSIYGFGEKQKICLLFANFRGAEYSDDQLEILRQRFGDGRVEIQKIGKKTQQEIVEWIKLAAKQFPDYVFIYRPHPGEKPKLVEAEIKDIPNIRIISDFSSRQWILVSDFMFSWHSTVIIEAYIAGKQCYSLEPYPYLESEDSNVFNGMRAVSSYELFEKILKGERYNNNLSKLEIERYFGRIDGEYAFKRVADAYIKVYQNAEYSLENIVDNFDLYKRRYDTIKECVWGNRIVNYFYWKYMDFCAKYLFLLDRNLSAQQYLAAKKNTFTEVVPDDEIRDIESKLGRIVGDYEEDKL